MKCMQWFKHPIKKPTTCEIPKPEHKTVPNYWDIACNQNPTKPGCKIYEN